MTFQGITGSHVQFKAQPSKESGSKSLKKKRKHSHLRSSDYDINNYISIGSSSTVITEQVRTEDIFTPTWRRLESDDEADRQQTTSESVSSDVRLAYL